MNLRLALLSTTCLLSSCRFLTVLEMKAAEDAIYNEWKNKENKTVIFIPMIHMGKREFYESAGKTIRFFKEQGYQVFYEEVSSEVPDTALTASMIADYMEYPAFPLMSRKELAAHVAALKLRRIVFLPERTLYKEGVIYDPFFKTTMPQPLYEDMGVTPDDIRVDVSLYDIVHAFEKTYGNIILKDEDFATDLRKWLAPVKKDARLDSLIVTMRDANLANWIQASDTSKIIVVYGRAHMKGTLQELKRLDKSWKTKKRNRFIL